MDDWGRIAELAARHAGWVVERRRDIHRRPELSGQEERTAALVASALGEMGIDVQDDIGGHGVIGLLRGRGGEGRTVALRADMDALPMEEATGLPWGSEVEGAMHACGHDAHTAMLLGAARVLSDMRDELHGNVKLLFQPAEEMSPTGGAPGMIADGALEDPYVDALFALHVWPLYETGKIALRPGPAMGASDRIFLTARGRSAHASAPDQGVDAILIAAHVVTALQSVASRSVSPLDAAVVTIGTVKGGWRYNVIADRVDMEGTVRTLREEVQEAMPGLIQRVSAGVASSLGGSCDVRYVKGYPPMVNDPALTERAAAVVRASLGPEALAIAERPELGAEDFAFFARERPAVMAWLGCRPKGTPIAETPMLHDTRFAPDEACFPLGVRFLAGCAWDFLSEGGER